MVAVCGCRPLGRSNRRVVLASAYPCPAGMDLGAPGVSGDSATRKVISVWSLSPHLVARHGIGDIGVGEPRHPTLRSSEGVPGTCNNFVGAAA